MENEKEVIKMKFKAILDVNEEMQIISEKDNRFHLRYEEEAGTFEEIKAKTIDSLENDKEWIDKQLERIGNLTREDYI